MTNLYTIALTITIPEPRTIKLGFKGLNTLRLLILSPPSTETQQWLFTDIIHDLATILK